MPLHQLRQQLLPVHFIKRLFKTFGLFFLDDFGEDLVAGLLVLLQGLDWNHSVDLVGCAFVDPVGTPELRPQVFLGSWILNLAQLRSLRRQVPGNQRGLAALRQVTQRHDLLVLEPWLVTLVSEHFTLDLPAAEPLLALQLLAQVKFLQ